MSLLDDQMAEVADFFVGRIVGESDVLFPEKLRRNRLDFSLESLRAVDEWLLHLHTVGVDPDAPDTAETLIWAGAYVGEVIRRNAKASYRWFRYDDYMATQAASLREMIPYTFGTQFMLAAGNSGMTLPINKVGRFLDEGPENNIHYYASGTIAP